MTQQYQITLTEQQLNTLGKLMDAGVRGLGLQAVHEASDVLRRIEAAQPVPAETPEESE